MVNPGRNDWGGGGVWRMGKCQAVFLAMTCINICSSNSCQGETRKKEWEYAAKIRRQLGQRRKPDHQRGRREQKGWPVGSGLGSRELREGKRKEGEWADGWLSTL